MVNLLRRQGIEVHRATRRRDRQGRRLPRRLVPREAQSTLRAAGEDAAREADLSGSAAHHLRRQRVDDAAGQQHRGQDDRGQGASSTCRRHCSPPKWSPPGRCAGVRGRRPRSTPSSTTARCNSITLRYRLKDTAVKAASASFKVGRRGVARRVVPAAWPRIGRDRPSSRSVLSPRRCRPCPTSRPPTSICHESPSIRPGPIPRRLAGCGSRSIASRSRSS